MTGGKFWTATIIAFAVFMLTPPVWFVAFADMRVFYSPSGLEHTVSQTVTDYLDGIGFNGSIALWFIASNMLTCGVTILVYHHLGWWMMPTRTRRLINEAIQTANARGHVYIAGIMRDALRGQER